ncbi:MAG: MiaB/RimO family radical SAM methylthiotransferase [Acidimicrobiales bacterium]
MAKRYFVRTYGCQMNEHDSERLAGLLEADGMVAADRLEDADVVLLNTCCIRENADNKLYGQLGHLKALKAARPEVQIAVAGCLAQKDRQLIQQRAGHVDVVFGTHNVHRVVELLGQARLAGGPVLEIWDEAADDPLDEAGEGAAFASALPARRELGWAAWLTVQVGCDNSCAFCIVPSVRGREISRPFSEVVAEAERLAAQGVVEVTLLGQNVNSYGRDLTTRLRAVEPSPLDAHLTGPGWAGQGRRARPLFADLLRAVAAVPGIRRVRFTSPHPKDLRAETIAAMAEASEVCEHLHLPLQAGSNRVLVAMHRGYTAERYLERLAAARAAVADLAVSTDLIVGFPGETDADFESTLEVAAAAGYDSAYTFIFSPRAGTEAAEQVERFVPRSVAQERFDRLKAVVERSALRTHRARIGRTEEVVVEGPNKRDASVTSGRTRQNKLVHFTPPAPLRPGAFVLVEVTEAGAHHLRGELVEILEQPRRRTRIPVASI